VSPLRLRAGTAEAVVDPVHGGALRSLRIGGVDILRPADPDATAPLDMACFPLVPYANRIAHGRFDFDGRTHQLPLNFGDHPHSLHGLGWTTPWDVREASEDKALLAYRHHGGPEWPWAHEAVQAISLDASGSIRLGLSVRNRSSRVMPAGLGFHPYFALPPESRLRFRASGVWLADGDMLPTTEAAAESFGDWGVGQAAVGEGLIDNCYAGWTGVAQIDRGDGTIVRLRAHNGYWLHLYRPGGRDFLCLEPVTHMPDAIHRPVGMSALGPGETMAISMTIALLDRSRPAD
jgi:aldose 1-epimerase